MKGRLQLQTSGRVSSPAPEAAHLVSLNGNDAVCFPVGVKVVRDNDRLLCGGDPLLAGLGVNLEDMSLGGEHWTLPVRGGGSLYHTHHCGPHPPHLLRLVQAHRGPHHSEEGPAHIPTSTYHRGVVWDRGKGFTAQTIQGVKSPDTHIWSVNDQLVYIWFTVALG